MASGLQVDDFLQPDKLARAISDMFVTWENQRATWLEQKKEVRDYIFATDTSTTSNSSLPWKNSTHLPKLCQIKDNLAANYMAALFPTDTPIRWEGDDESAEAKEKRLTIESYMNNKMRMSEFRTEVSKIIDDYIIYGNCFGMPVFIAESITDEAGIKTSGYVGPRLQRISPLDIVFNPAAMSFDDAPKIIHSMKTLSSLHSDIENKPEMGYLKEVFTKVIDCRHKFNGLSAGDFAKSQAFAMDGFNSFLDYFQSDYIETLDFYGDIYDPSTDTFYKNQLITIVDRSHIIRRTTNPSWLGKSPIFHAGWRLRPDNLYAMGPLDNLVGMQYRIDHLENAKADAFDLIIHPVMKIKGYVEDFEYGPGERIFCGDEGDVEFQAPDTTMLNADTQIAIYQQQMEEMAGAPKQAMGQRTPGEKTAYEVQVLENGANRIFLNKTAYFEESFLEPILNAMLELARRNMGVSDLIRVVDDQYGVVSFLKITKEDLVARGKIRPVGARHFARNANMIQNITQLYSSSIGQDPAVLAHISGKSIARMFEELLGIERYHIVKDNIRIAEMHETQQLGQASQQINMEQMSANPMVQQPQVQ